MNFIVWLIAGALVGWGASLVMGTNSRQGCLMDVIVGIAGAALAGFLLSPLVGVSTINQDNFSLAGLLVSLLGAVILLAVVRAFTRARV